MAEHEQKFTKPLGIDYSWINEEETWKLKKMGFSDLGIAKLTQLRKRFLLNEYFDDSVMANRLEFARWLVVHGRIKE